MTRDEVIRGLEICTSDRYCYACPLDDIDESVSTCMRTLMDGALTLLKEEPKRGKWVHVYGYVTPGGDPVWRCSECGKGEHIYGIEHGTYGADIADHQWVACPNCGARMEADT